MRRKLLEHLPADATGRGRFFRFGGDHDRLEAAIAPAPLPPRSPLRSAHIAAGYDAFSTLQPSVMLLSDPEAQRRPGSCEYGAYARSMAANARSRRHGDRPGRRRADRLLGRSPTGILTGDQLREKGRSPSAKLDPEPFADRGAEIGERRPVAERGGIAHADRSPTTARTLAHGRSIRWSGHCRDRR